MAVHTFKCIDAHTCGNPVRLVMEGGPELVGATMNEKRLHFLKEFDWIRTGLMFEPRGHDMMSGSILYPPHESKQRCCGSFYRNKRLSSHVRSRHYRDYHNCFRKRFNKTKNFRQSFDGSPGRISRGRISPTQRKSRMGKIN